MCAILKVWKKNKDKGLLFASFFLFFIALSLCLPIIQEFLIYIGELLVKRSLNHSIWKTRMINYAVKFFMGNFFLLFYIFFKTEKYQFWYESRRKKVDVIICVSVCVLCFVLFLLPFVIFGQNSVITIHDNLDDSVPRFRYLHQNNLFWTFFKELPVMNGISTLFFNREGYTVYNAIYCLLPTYEGYVINNILCVILGFLSMFFLQKNLFKSANIIILTFTSLAYSLLPSVCCYKMGVATMPFAFLLFYKLLATKENRWMFLSFFYPFFTDLVGTGLFVCGFWLFLIIICSIKNKKIEWRLIVALILICLGFVITNSRLIYMRFILNEHINRDNATVEPMSFIYSFVAYFFKGCYHSATLQNPLINCVILCVLILIFVKKFKQKNIFIRNVLILCVSLSFFCSFIASLSDAKIIGKIIAVVFPPLKGISFARVYTISRVACYVAFTACLLYIANNKLLYGLHYIIAVLQIIVIFSTKTFYNDSCATWQKNFLGSKDITWNEFFSENFFSKIKKSLEYNDEPVCAVGYHPAVLLYNGFNTIDGYISVYPYGQQLLWHDLMKPEFEQNEVDMKYFDSWGGRRYVYNKDLRYAPTREKNHGPIDLHIDMSVLKNDFHCKYILSRAELSNAAELGLKHLDTFDNPESFYVIWVYDVIK